MRCTAWITRSLPRTAKLVDIRQARSLILKVLDAFLIARWKVFTIAKPSRPPAESNEESQEYFDDLDPTDP